MNESKGDFLGIFVFDKWACQTDQRQAILIPQSCSEGYRIYRAMMIDQGFCFNDEKWNFPDASLYSIYVKRIVYRNVIELESFDPWLERLESRLSLSLLKHERMIERLDSRRKRVPELIWSTRNTDPKIFPN